VVAGIVAAGIAMAPQLPLAHRVATGVRVGAPVRSDLDAFTDAQLDRDLQDELDDVFEDHGADEVADVATIQADLMEALSDAGDEGHEAEISFADLEAEMQEAGTSIEEVVHDALVRLDRAAVDRPRVHLAVWRTTGDVGQKPSYGLAVRDAKRSLIREIRKAR
jgi:hypothetical protein